MDVLRDLRITTRLPDSHQSNTGICVRRTLDICFPHAQRENKQFSIRDWWRCIKSIHKVHLGISFLTLRKSEMI